MFSRAERECTATSFSGQMRRVKDIGVAKQSVLPSQRPIAGQSPSIWHGSMEET